MFLYTRLDDVRLSWLPGIGTTALFLVSIADPASDEALFSIPSTPEVSGASHCRPNCHSSTSPMLWFQGCIEDDVMRAETALTASPSPNARRCEVRHIGPD